MHKAVDIIRFIRQGLLQHLEAFSLDQLNEIPEGLNNNLIWHLGHLISVQQNVCYQRSGLAPMMDVALIAQYANGTKPQGPVDQAHVDHLKSLALSTLDQFEQDLRDNKFTAFEAMSLRDVLHLNTIDDAADFLAMHEGMHYGNVAVQKRLLRA